jgi:UDP-N-acetylglucosamine/UDP-N-acetyl-alpha-D-glucosaminouronate 4-epimerase
VKVLVTGGAGFIGHHLVRALLHRGDEVVVLDDFSTGDRARLHGTERRIRLVTGSILDDTALDDATVGCDAILHQAALPSVARSVRDPLRSNEVNVAGTVRVMLAAERHRVRRVVYAGSSSVYGSGGELPRRETQRPDPASPYATSKLAAEGYVHALGDLHGIETASLRYFNVFGPGQDPDSEYSAVIPRFVTAALSGQEPVIFGDGSVSRDFTYIDNVVQANLGALDAPRVQRLTCNIGCGERRTLLDLVDAIGVAVGRRLSPTFSDPRPGDVPHSQADIEVARAVLGYRPTIGLDEGIVKTVAWYGGVR